MSIVFPDGSEMDGPSPKPEANSRRLRMGELPIVERLHDMQEKLPTFSAIPDAARLITELVAALEIVREEMDDPCRVVSDGIATGTAFSKPTYDQVDAVLARARSKGGE